ncbi:MAG: 5-formyltetrahydrofolate cyclo-ligase [Candidatus Binataceae bacterium]
MAKCVADEKKYVRRILRDARLALDGDWVAGLSATIQARLIASDCYRDCARVVLYSSNENEVRTSLICADALVSGRVVYFPRIAAEHRDLSLVRVRDPADFRPGAFGILEPAGAEIAAPEQLGRALICVPGVAFSMRGQRLGRGGGYYDRLIARAAPQVVTAGLAYSFQVLDRLPESPHDRRLDLIATESAIFAAGRTPRPVAPWPDQGGIPRC